MSSGTLTPELLTTAFAEQQTKGEVDMQIATAKRFPRSIKQFKSDAISLATLDEETASSCFYTLPARKGGNGKPIEGPSARLAEIVAGAWGNIRAQAAIVDDDGQSIVSQGRCWDLEKNVAIAVDVRRRITSANGARYSADMINTTANAACSIALRNAVFKIVPMALVKPIYEAARKVAIGDATTLVKRRADMVTYFAKMGVKSEQLCAVVDKASLDDIDVDDLATLKGLATAIKEGDTTIDEAFPQPEKEKPKEPEGKSASDKLADSLVATDTNPTDAPKSKGKKTAAEPVTTPFDSRIASATTTDELDAIQMEADMALQKCEISSAQFAEVSRLIGLRVQSL